MVLSMEMHQRVCGGRLLWKRKERKESGNEVLIGWPVEQPLSRLSGTLRLSPVLPLGGEIPRGDTAYSMVPVPPRAWSSDPNSNPLKQVTMGPKEPWMGFLSAQGWRGLNWIREKV